MNKIQAWRQDLKSGKNAEVYILLISATFFIILGILGIVNLTIVTAGILWALALLAFSMLNTRHDMGRLSETLLRLENSVLDSDKRVSQKVSAALSNVACSGAAMIFFKNRKEVGEIPELVEGANVINLSMVGGIFITHSFSAWENKLKNKDTRIRFLLANPCDDEHICTLISRFDPVTNGDADWLRHDLTKVVQVLRSVQNKGYPGLLELKFYKIVPSFGIFAINPDNAEGIIKVEMFPYLTPIEKRPHFVLRKDRDGEWYDLFRQQFEEQWKDSLKYEEIESCFKVNKSV